MSEFNHFPQTISLTYILHSRFSVTYTCCCVCITTLSTLPHLQYMIQTHTFGHTYIYSSYIHIHSVQYSIWYILYLWEKVLVEVSNVSISILQYWRDLSCPEGLTTSNDHLTWPLQHPLRPGHLLKEYLHSLTLLRMKFYVWIFSWKWIIMEVTINILSTWKI